VRGLRTNRFFFTNLVNNFLENYQKTTKPIFTKLLIFKNEPEMVDENFVCVRKIKFFICKGKNYESKVTLATKSNHKSTKILVKETF
jgi:hypothetical protein